VQTFRGFFIAKILIIKEPFMKLSGAEIIIKSLKKHSVDTVVGIKSFSCNRWDGFSFAPEDYFNSEGPLIIYIKMDKEYNVYPMVPPGDENINMLLESNA
jgi:thiamine pyrophosphate-dependent acetolactate synthase large subunit-like protein